MEDGVSISAGVSSKSASWRLWPQTPGPRRAQWFPDVTGPASTLRAELGPGAWSNAIQQTSNGHAFRRLGHRANNGRRWSNDIRSMVLLLPPAPAARVLLGRAFAAFSLISAAARRRMAVRAPPGGRGEDGPVPPRDAPVVVPVAGLAAESLSTGGEPERGDDCCDERANCVSFTLRMVKGSVRSRPLDTAASSPGWTVTLVDAVGQGHAEDVPFLTKSLDAKREKLGIALRCRQSD